MASEGLRYPGLHLLTGLSMCWHPPVAEWWLAPGCSTSLQTAESPPKGRMLCEFTKVHFQGFETRSAINLQNPSSKGTPATQEVHPI